jgi:hypothetical protein
MLAGWRSKNPSDASLRRRFRKAPPLLVLGLCLTYGPTLLSATALGAGARVNPGEHPITNAHDPITHALEQAVCALHGRRQRRPNPVATQTLTGLGAGRKAKNGEGSRSREQRSAGH